MKNNQWIPWAALIALAIIFFLYVRSHTPTNGTGDNSKDSILRSLDGTVASLRKTVNDFSTERAAFLDSLARIYQTRPKDIKEIITIIKRDTIEIHGRDSIIKIIDSAGQVTEASQFFTNPYYSIKATLNFKSPQMSVVNLTSYDTITAVWKTVTEGGFFNKKTFLQLDLHSANPNSQITGIHAYRQAVPKTPAFGLGLVAGYGYGFNSSTSIKPTFIIGVGLAWTPLHF